MKSAIIPALLAFGLLSGTAFAGTAKPAQNKILPAKIDTITTQSIEPKANCAKSKFALVAACGKPGSYPENAFSGMNLGY